MRAVGDIVWVFDSNYSPQLREITRIPQPPPLDSCAYYTNSQGFEVFVPSGCIHDTLESARQAVDSAIQDLTQWMEEFSE